MGTSIGIAGTLNLWLVSLGHSAATGGFFFSAYVLLMLVGRLLASSFAQKIPVRSMLAGASASALLLLILGVFLAGITVKVPVLAGSSLELVAVPLTAPLLVCCGLFTSVMWSSIFALSVEGLGEATASASGWFMTMVAGGGLIPLFQNFIADQAGFRVSYIVPALVFVYLLAYSFKLSKVR
jgi:FHS family L-fucose permease-like MFS transporter